MPRILPVTVILFLAAIIPTLPASEPRREQPGDALPRHALVRFGSPCGRAERPLRFLAFRPDGKTLVSLDDEYRLYLWDPATGKRVDDYPEQARREWGKRKEDLFPSPVATLSPDGKVVVVF